MWKVKDVYYVSGSTGILAADFGRALLRQFPEVSFHEEKIPFVKSREQAKKVRDHILAQSGGRSPLVFCTLVEPRIREVFDCAGVEFFDVFEGMLDRLEKLLEARAIRLPGYSRRASEIVVERRVDAINFTLDHDDGIRPDEYEEADLIILGVSRAGKTPIAVYLATQHGLKAANFPFTPEILAANSLPAPLHPILRKCIGLNTSPQILQHARNKRYPGSNYAKISTCMEELNQALLIFSRHDIPVIDTTGNSIEETATQVLAATGFGRTPVTSSG